MSIEPNDIFEVMQCAYRNEVLDKFMCIEAQALEAAMEATGMNMQDLLNRMDDTEEETIQKIDKLFGKVSPFLKCAANDHLMKFISRLMNVPLIKHWMIKFIKRSLLKVMTNTTPPSLPDRVKSSHALKSAGYGGMKNG